MCQNTCSNIFSSGAQCQHMPLSYFSLLMRLTALENKFSFARSVTQLQCLDFLFCVFGTSCVCAIAVKHKNMWSRLLCVTLQQHQNNLRFRHFKLLPYTVISYEVCICCFCYTKFCFTRITHHHTLNRFACM